MMVDGMGCICILGTLFLILSAARLVYSAKKYGIRNKSNITHYDANVGKRL